MAEPDDELAAEDSTGRRLLAIAAVVVAVVAASILVPGWIRDRATPELVAAWVVSAQLGDRVAGTAPREVRPGTPITLYAVVEADPGEGSRLFGPVERVRLGGPKAEARPVHPWSEWAHSLEILWFKVEPLRPYENASADEAFGAGEIRYADTLMANWGFRTRHAADIRPTGDDFPALDVGTMRYKIRAVVRDSEDRILDQVGSAGAESVLAERAVDRPLRVSVRGADDALGWLMAWCGLPYVPLAPSQARVAAPRFVGGTVLDFWISARRRRGGGRPTFIRWNELPERAERVVDEMFLARDGAYYYTDDPLEAVTFERVRPGDVVTIDDHVGILARDSGPEGEADGMLNRWDRVIEAYFEPLDERAMGDAFVSGASVWRLGDGGQGAAREEGR